MNLQSLNYAEKSIFDEARKNWGDEKAYEQNWLYVIQACRNGGLICRSDDGWVAVALHYLGREKHALVVPLSNNMRAFLIKALQYLYSKNIHPNIIKHIQSSDEKDVLGNNLFPRCETVTTANFLDDFSEDIFPQVLINIRKPIWRENKVYSQYIPILPQGASSKDFRYQLRRFCRRNLQNGNSLKIKDFIMSTPYEIESVINYWLKSVKVRFSKKPNVSISDFNQCFKEPILPIVQYSLKNPHAIYGNILLINDIPKAFWIGSPISQCCLGVYALIADSHVINLSDITLYLAFQKAHELGFDFVNLGGSELESLFKFKTKVFKKTDNNLYLRKVFDFDCDLFFKQLNSK